MTPVRHDVSDFLIIELEDIADHPGFTFFYNALLMPLAHHHDDLFFGDILLGIAGINTEQAHQARGDQAYKPDERPAYH